MAGSDTWTTVGLAMWDFVDRGFLLCYSDVILFC